MMRAIAPVPFACSLLEFHTKPERWDSQCTIGPKSGLGRNGVLHETQHSQHREVLTQL